MYVEVAEVGNIALTCYSIPELSEQKASVAIKEKR